MEFRLQAASLVALTCIIAFRYASLWRITDAAQPRILVLTAAKDKDNVWPERAYCAQVHHQVAETVCNHPPLLQCARVVTWLEALFCKSQTYAAEQDQGESPYISPNVTCLEPACLVLLTRLLEHLQFVAFWQVRHEIWKSVTNECGLVP